MHAFAKTMNWFSAATMWLKCTFHKFFFSEGPKGSLGEFLLNIFWNAIRENGPVSFSFPQVTTPVVCERTAKVRVWSRIWSRIFGILSTDFTDFPGFHGLIRISYCPELLSARHPRNLYLNGVIRGQGPGASILRSLRKIYSHGYQNPLWSPLCKIPGNCVYCTFLRSQDGAANNSEDF